MKIVKLRFKSRLLALVLLVIMCSSWSLSALASSVSAADAYSALVVAVEKGYYMSADGSAEVDVQTKTYKTTGGGYLLYSEITCPLDDSEPFVDETQFAKLTSSSKQALLQDQLRIANLMAADTDSGNAISSGGVTNETVISMTNVLQQKSGMGSQLLATLLQNTKPDYVTANRIYEPFSGPIGTILGLGSIVIIAFLAVHMILDLCFINLPGIQLLFGDGDSKDGEKKYSKLISRAARTAVKQAEGESGNGSSGGGKSATWIYFWSEVKELTILVIALLYLVAGAIFSGIAQIIDLFSGFLGF